MVLGLLDHVTAADASVIRTGHDILIRVAIAAVAVAVGGGVEVIAGDLLLQRGRKGHAVQGLSHR